MHPKKFKKSKKKIILIVPDVLKVFSGVEIHGENLYKYLKKNSLLKACISYKHKKITNNSEIDDGVYKTNITKKIQVDAYLTKNKLKDNNLIQNYINSSKDKVTFFLNNPSWLSLFEKIDKKRYNLIVRSSGNDILAGWDVYSENNKNKIIQLINEKVDFLIVNSQYTFEKFVEFGIEKNKLVKIIGGVNQNFKKTNIIFKFILKKKLDLPFNKKIIINCSRFVKFKGIENTLYSIKKLKEKSDLKFIYLIIGSGPLEEEYRKLIKTLNLNEEVKLINYKKPGEIKEYLMASDLFLHLPINYKNEKNIIQTETMGRSVCEAVCCGLPVITSNIGGVQEIIDHELNGYISEPENFEKIALLIDKILTDKKKYNEMVLKSKIKAKEYYWDKIFNKYKKLI